MLQFKTAQNLLV